MFPHYYKNEVMPVKSCIHYSTYKCHINHYCDGDKQCEKEARRYWLGADWLGKDGKKIDSLEWHATYCERIQKQCDATPKGDRTCLK